MHLIFEWDDETGETTLSPESLESLQEMYGHSPITALDFLKDAHALVHQEYCAAVRAFHAHGAVEGNGG